MKNRMLAAMLALLLLCTVLPVSALADGVCGESTVWTLSDGGVLTISGAGAMADFEPGDAPWYARRGEVRSLVIEDGVTAVGSAAFSGCGLIEEVSLPLTLRRIGDSAFDDVYALRSVYYAGSIAQWKAIDIGLGNGFGTAQLVCADKSEPFSDISGWCRDYIVTCYMADIVGGFPDGTFRPGLNVTRAQFIMMLYNLGGRPAAPDTELVFTDRACIAEVYSAAVKWGVKAGIINGFEDNSFRPNDSISRAQMSAFAYRFLSLGVSGAVLDGCRAPNSFRDYGDIAGCYREAVDVTANIGVIEGYADGSYRPNGIATRGQSAAVMARLLSALTELREQ